MKIFLRLLQLGMMVMLVNSAVCFAKKPTAKHPDQLTVKSVNGPVEAREMKQEKISYKDFAIALYKPTYILPYYYTGSPDTAAYQGTTPNNERLKNAEIKYQISLKVPVWKNMFGSSTSLYFAYTQLSYWQLYAPKAFMRENDYEPEVFFANHVDWHLFNKWNLNFLNVGAEHQSNGFGNSLERSWNRLYLDAIASNDNWMVDIKPWYILSKNANNTNIANYLGYVKVIVAYKYHQQVFTIQGYNLIEHGGKRPSAEVTWSFPLTKYIKGYLQAFSGYGQSLIEYNHHTNSAGIGLSFNDWI